MAEFMKIEIHGDKEIDRALERAGKAFSEPVIMAALETGAQIVEVDAKIRVPKKTRQLEKSIHTKSIEGSFAVIICTGEPYAKRIERGFVGRDSLGRRYNQPAQPYLRPALNENRERIFNIVRDEIMTGLRKAVR